MLHKLTSKFLGLSLITVSLFGVAYSSHAYTKPGNPTGFVNDFARVLSASEVQALNQTLTAFQASTTNEIAVVTIQSLGGDSVENYAEKLFQDWKIGTAENDNGILLLVAIEEREMKIEVGYGLEGALPDSIANRIILDDITPRFKEGNYGAGIAAGVGSIMAATQGEYKNQASFDPSKVADSLQDVPFGLFVFLAFVIINVLARISVPLFGKSKSWWQGGVIGAVIGVVISLFVGFIFTGIFITVGLVLLGLLLDFLASKGIIKNRPPGSGGSHGGGFFGGGFGGGSSGGSSSSFGGFGGGSSGGGGASGRW